MDLIWTVANQETNYDISCQIAFKLLSRHGFCIKCYCDLDLWPTGLNICRGHLMNVTSLPTKYNESLINFSRYWADTVFGFAKILLWPWPSTLKCIGVVYWVWPVFLPSTMTVTRKLFKILSGHSFCIKCYCDLDLWPSDLNIYRGHLLSMTNLPTKYHDCHLATFQDIEQTWFLHKMLLWPWHLTYWPQNE